MSKLSFYDQVAMVIPSAAIVFIALLLIPDLRFILLTHDGVTIPSLGLFLVVAYAAGHSVAPVGRLMSGLLWWWQNGEPSDWVTRDPPSLLREDQLKNVQDRVRTNLNLDIGRIPGMQREQWGPVFAEILRHARRSSDPDRIEVFLSAHALNRSLAGSFLATSVAWFFFQPSQWWWGVVLLLLCVLHICQMRRSFIRFAEEVLFQFLAPSSSAMPSRRHTSRRTGDGT
jgi:hypothetical protein